MSYRYKKREFELQTEPGYSQLFTAVIWKEYDEPGIYWLTYHHEEWRDDIVIGKIRAKRVREAQSKANKMVQKEFRDFVGFIGPWKSALRMR